MIVEIGRYVQLFTQKGPHCRFPVTAARDQARIRNFSTLDALRGVAALCVLLFHAAFFFDLNTPSEGYLAVDLFFIMSGFIVAYRYESELAHGMTLHRFLAIRLARLYPLFLLGTLLGAIPALIALAIGRHEVFRIAAVKSLPLALVMLPSTFALPYMNVLYPLNYVSWSLSLEVIINAGFAASVMFWSTSRVIVFAALSAVCLACIAFRFGSLNIGWGWNNVIGGVPRVCFGFSIGVLLFRAYTTRPFTFRAPWWLPIILIPSLLFVNLGDPGTTRAMWDVAMVTLVLPTIVVIAIANDPPRLAQGLCALAGVSSYVIYSLHTPFIAIYMRGETLFGFDVSSASPVRALMFACMLTCTCAVAHVAFDKPIRASLGRSLRQRHRWHMPKGSLQVPTMTMQSSE